jgi:hypothetical protein
MARWESKREFTKRLEAESSKRLKEAKASGKHIVTSDYGRQSVYDNERIIWDANPEFTRSMSIAELTTLVAKVFADERVIAIDAYPGEKVYVENTWKAGAICYTLERRLRFGTEKHMFVAMHEMAHILEPLNSHGDKFCEAYCKLVRWFIDEAIGNQLRMRLIW